MRKIYSVLLLTLIILFASISTNAQSYWQRSSAAAGKIATDKAVARLSYPKEFKLFDLNLAPLREELFTVTDNRLRHNTVITLPNADGQLEQFEVVEASNFDATLQARFPEIRAFSGRSITDKSATLKLSISPQGIQTMVFRVDKPNEFIEAYSADHTVYSVFRSQRKAGQLPWTCSTVDNTMATGLNARVAGTNFTASNAGQLKTMRLAQSVTAEYSNYFGATTAAQSGLVLAAVNATLTRCNGCYEKDLAVHLNLIANTTSVFFYDPATDPYSTAPNIGPWNAQLQATLTANIGEANYDIGHLFGQSGGGGNAGCIGCVCVDGQKGSGITSPADGIPMGDNFDIDYVVHEVGHQMGATHTFTFQSEGGPLATSSQREVGSGISIMGYAGITPQDDSLHSIPYYHEYSILQIQNNLATKTCPVTTNITATNATPVVAPVSNFTIPITTPFALTASATDANGADVLTYQWEQNDPSTTATGNASGANITKAAGPNWLSFNATTSPIRLFPRLTTILTGASTTASLGGAGPINVEALSSVSRTLNFRVTVRDNHPYSSTVPLAVGQTAFTDMVVTVDATVGPFLITSQNAAVTYPQGSTQTVTWSVNGTTGAPTNTANVKISWSSDGGGTFPIVLAASTANSGTATVTIPSIATTTGRIKVEAIGNIYFDINNANITVSTPTNDFAFGASTASTTTCPSGAATVTIPTTVTGVFVTPIVLTATAGVPAGTTVTFVPNPLTPGSSAVATLNNANTLAAGTYIITVTGTAGATVHTTNITYTITAGTGPVITAQPTNQTVCAPAAATFTSATAAGGVTYQWQSAPTIGGTYTNIAGATSATYNTGATTAAMNGMGFHVIVSTQCGTTTSNNALLTVNSAASITTQPTNQSACTGNPATFTVVGAGTGVTYQWQSATAVGGPYTPIAGATSATYTIPSVTVATPGFYNVVLITTLCAATVTSNNVSLSISTTTSITTQPTAQTVCAPTAGVFTVVAAGSGNNYQWQVSTVVVPAYTNIAGATSATYNTGATTTAMSGNSYHVVITGACNTVTSNNVTLTVNAPASITTQPTNQAACTGNPATFTVVGAGTGVTYQWQSATVVGGPYTPIAGATSATYSIPSVTVATAGFYNVVLTTTLCAATVTSNNVTLTINTTTAINTQPTNQTVCAPAAATFTVAAAGTALTYQWQVSTATVPAYTNIPGATGVSYNTGATTAAMSGNSYHVVVTGTCNTVTSSNVTLTVNTAAAITGNPTDVTVCNGTPASFTVTSSGSGATIQWQSAPALAGPYTNIAGATSATYTIASTTPAMNNTYYQAVVTTVTCAGTATSTAAHLTVNTVANITTQPTNQSACIPNAAVFTVAATGTGLTYQWQVSTAAVPAFTDIPGATSATYTINPTAITQNNNQYRVQILSTCSPTTPTTSNAVTLTVNNPVSVSQNPQAQRGCLGDNFTYTVTAVSTGTVTYQWQVSTNGGTTYTDITGATAAAYTLTNPPIYFSGNLYRVVVSGVPCGVVTTPGALLTLGYRPTVILSALYQSTLDPSRPSVLTATVSPAVSSNLILNWTNNGVTIPNTTATTVIPITVDNFGTYQVTATDATSGCSTASNIVVIDSLPSSHLFIYPNPVHTTAQVRYYSTTPLSHGTMLSIYDSKGARVFAKAFTVVGTYGRMDIDMTGMSTGTYSAELRDASGHKLASALVMKGL